MVTGGEYLSKKEAFENVRSEKKDQQKINIKSLRFGWVCVTIALIIVGTFRYMNNQTVADLLIIMTAYLAGTSFYQYMHTKKKDYLFTAIMGLIAGGLAFAALLSEYGVY